MMVIKQLTILVFLALLWANSAKADSYKGPKFESKTFKTNKVKVKNAKWDSDARFKVQENSAPQRELASGEDEDTEEIVVPKRNPSSSSVPMKIKKDVVKKAKEKVRSWKWESPKE